MFLGALDLTVNVALPAITTSFDTDMTTVQWIIICYIGTSTGLQLVLGRLADSHGLKRFYLIGIGIYTVSVALIGLAPALEWVLALRVLQAVGYGLMVTTVPALVTNLFPENQRGRALGSMMSVGTVGMITATLGGGYLVDAYGWSSIFLARVPIGLVAFALAFFVLREHRSDDSDEKPGTLGIGGVVGLFVSLSALVLFLNLGGRLGWTDPWVMGLAAVCACATLVFVRIESRSSSPIVALDLFSPAVNRALFAGFVMSMATFVNLFILPFFVSDVVGADAWTLGVLLTIPPIVSAIAAPVAGWMSDRFVPRWVAAAAMAIIGVSMFAFTSLDRTATAYDVGIRLALFGIGMGGFQSSNASSVMGNIPANRLGMGAALLSLAFSLGMITSVGLMTAIFDALKESALTVAADERQAFVDAFSQTYLVSAAMMVVGFVALVVGRSDASSKRSRPADVR